MESLWFPFYFNHCFVNEKNEYEINKCLDIVNVLIRTYQYGCVGCQCWPNFTNVCSWMKAAQLNKTSTIAKRNHTQSHIFCIMSSFFCSVYTSWAIWWFCILFYDVKSKPSCTHCIRLASWAQQKTAIHQFFSFSSALFNLDSATNHTV